MLLFSCKKEQPIEEASIIYLSENAKSFFPYDTDDTLIFADSLGNQIQYVTNSPPNSSILESKEKKYVNFINEINDMKILYQISAWQNDLHYLTIVFFIEPQPQIIEEGAAFNYYTDTISPYFSFNKYDSTYNQTYDSIQLNSNIYYNVVKLWGTDNNPVKTVYFVKDRGVVGYIDNTNMQWNLNN
jgi:hypothetical protein